MKARLAFLALTLFAVAFAPADLTEEETWYNAEGEVVKKVKRTLTGKDARSTADWEPAWVARERLRDERNRVSYYSPRRSYRGPYARGYYTPYRSFYYYTPRTRRGGLTGYLGSVRGRTHWGIGYRRAGINLLITR